MDPHIIGEFVEYLAQKGYPPVTVRYYEKALKQMPDTWNTQDAGELYEHIKSALCSGMDSLATSDRQNLGPAARHLFHMVTGVTFKGYERQRIQNESRYSAILSGFLAYSTGFKHMKESTAEAETSHVRRFLERTGRAPEALQELSAADIRDYVNREFRGLRTSSIGRYVTSIRNFFRFLEYEGLTVSQSILDIPLSPAAWARSKVPVVLTKEEELRLRGHYGTADAIGVRNSLIVRLMLDLGLRCAEVADLSIDDVRWGKGTICVRRTKSASGREVPFPQEFGDLLENYVLNFRPWIPDRHLFLRRVRGDVHSRMTRECVRGVVRRALAKEDIRGWWKGTHALRRTAASKLYNAGNGLKTVADMLGHETVDATTAYVKVDFQRLRTVAAPWPGEDVDGR